MNILKKSAPLKKLLKISARQCIHWAVTCALVSATEAYAQNEKQISYPVAVPIEHAAASSAPAAPVYKAPAPVIRPLDEASTPPVTPKKSVKKTAPEKLATEKPADKSTKQSVAKKEAAKATVKATNANTTKAAATKKVTTEKSGKNSADKNSAAPSKNTPAKNPTAASTKKNVAAVKPELETPLPPLVAAPLKASESHLAQASQVATVSPALKMAIAPAATTGLAKTDFGDEEDQLTEGTLDEEDYASGPELAAETKPLALTPATASNVKNSPLPMSNIREGFILEFKDYVETKIVPRVPGLAVAIIADGKVKVLQAYGVKKIGGNDPINTDTAFRLASVSKTIAGTAAGVLVSDGLINWDTPITSVLPNVEFSNPRYGNQLTLRNIMSQSTGLPTHAGDNYIEEGLPYDEVLQKLKAVNFVCPPGKCYSYQNVTLSLLANIVAKKTGKPYEQYVKEKLFVPLGMRSASVGLEGLLATKNYALPHEVSGRGQWYTKEITQNYYRLNPAAGANASINDMARWVLAHMGHNPDVLSPATLQAVHAKVTKNTPAQSHYGAREGVTDTHYGMGWRTFDYRGDKNFLHHGGYVFGSRSEMVFNPELQIGMVILSNCNRLPGEIIFRFLDAYEDEKRGEKRPVSPPQPVKNKAKKK